MQDLNDKNTGNSLSANEWNQQPTELQNIIEQRGITLSGLDLNQVGKAIAGYAANGSFFTDSGAANNYVLTPISLIQAPPNYRDGDEIVFLPANNSTGLPCTVNRAGAGVKSLKDQTGGLIAQDAIAVGSLVTARFNLAADEFRILPSLSQSIISTLLAGRKNHVINGDFLINQRGTAFVNPQYGVDQWQHAVDLGGGSLVSFTHGSLPFALGQTEVPNNPERHAYFSGYITGGGVLRHVVFRQRIESVIPLAGKEVTLSFWAKGTIAGIITLGVRQFFGTGGSPSAVVNTALSQNISLTTDWQKFTFTGVMPSISGKTLGTNFNDFRLLEFSTETGAAIAAEYGTAPVSYQGTVQLSDVQFEAGNNATAFERLLFGAQMSLCRRYFQNNFIAGVTATVGRALDGTTLVHTHIPFSIMRTAPSATMTTPSNFGGVLRIDSNGSIPDGPITVVPVSNSGLRFFSSHTGAAGGRLYGGEIQSNFAIFLSAELN